MEGAPYLNSVQKHPPLRHNIMKCLIHAHHWHRIYLSQLTDTMIQTEVWSKPEEET